MKILFFSSYFYPYVSGITTYPLKILLALSKKNKVTVLTFPHVNNLKPTQKIDGLKIVRMPYLFKISKGFISLLSFWYFWKEAKKADIILLNIPNFEGLALAAFGKLLNKKIYSIFHCQVYLTSNFWNKIVSRALDTSIFFQFLLSDRIVAYTKDYVQNSFAKEFINKIEFILPPIAKLPVNNEKLIKKNRVLLGYAGRVSSEKGLEYLIEAAGVLKNKFELEIVFAGPYGRSVAGEKEYYDKIEALLKKYHIRHRFLGTLEGSELGAFYTSIDLLVLPSINSTEAFGMVQVEAMLVGTPVVTTDLPGVRVPISLTGMGLVVDPKNSRALAGAINVILKNKNKFTNEELIRKAEKIFSNRKVYGFYEALIKK
jgi:glycosyltransferase involved in cell wall biosynthesis